MRRSDDWRCEICEDARLDAKSRPDQFSSVLWHQNRCALILILKQQHRRILWIMRWERKVARPIEPRIIDYNWSRKFQFFKMVIIGKKPFTVAASRHWLCVTIVKMIYEAWCSRGVYCHVVSNTWTFLRDASSIWLGLQTDTRTSTQNDITRLIQTPFSHRQRCSMLSRMVYILSYAPRATKSVSVPDDTILKTMTTSLQPSVSIPEHI